MELRPITPLNVKIGATIQRLRLNKGLTQQQLADVSGYKKQYLSFIEQGRKGVSLPVLIALAHALKVQSAEILKGITYKDLS